MQARHDQLRIILDVVPITTQKVLSLFHWNPELPTSRWKIPGLSLIACMLPE
jgi:hypothetical protein